MRAVLGMCLAAGALSAALANGSNALELTTAELERLGVGLAPAEVALRVTIASVPAEVVIPAARQAIVSTTVSGVLSRLLVAEGDSVEAGQPLAEIQSPELLSLEKGFIDATAAAELARTQLERDRGLYADGIVAERRLRESVVAARAADTTLDQARQQLVIAGMAEPEMARLADSRELSRTLLLRAPFDAVVVSQLRPVGAHVDSLEPLFNIADLTELWIEAHVPQESAGRVESGMQIVVTANDRVLQAGIIHVGRVVDSASQTVLVRGVVENRGLFLRAGQSLTVRIAAFPSGVEPVLAVPRAAIVHAEGGPFVFVRTTAGMAASPVEILATDGEQAYLSAGLDVGVDVAISGVATLKSIWLESQSAGE